MVDWLGAEGLYRQGEISVREIARREGVTEGAVRKRAKAQGWFREASTQIGVDAEVEAVALAIRSIPTQGVRVHERVFWAYARAAVEAAGRARASFSKACSSAGRRASPSRLLGPPRSPNATLSLLGCHSHCAKRYAAPSAVGMMAAERARLIGRV